MELVVAVLRGTRVLRAPVGAVRLDDEPDVLEHGGDGLLEALRIRHVRPGHARGRPEVNRRGIVLAVAGLLEQRPSCVRIVRIGVLVADAGADALVPAAGRRQEDVGDRAASTVERVDQRLLVDREGDRLANGDVGEDRVLLRQRVQAKVQAVERQALHEGEPVGGLDRLVVGRADEVIALDAAALEGLQPGRRVLDRANDHAVEVGRVAPVVFVADQHGAVVGDVVLEDERTGAALDDLGAEGARRRIVGVGLLQDRRADDRERRQREPEQEGRARVTQGERDRQVIGRLDALDQVVRAEPVHDGAVVVGIRLELLGEVLPAVEVDLHGLGVEVGPVVELDPLAQVEDVGRVGGLTLPALGQHADELVGRSRGEVDERLVDLLKDAERLAVAGQCGIEARRQARAGKDQRAALLWLSRRATVLRRGRGFRTGRGRCLRLLLRRTRLLPAGGQHQDQDGEDGDPSPVTHPHSSKRLMLDADHRSGRRHGQCR